jgi:hypothetical protein
MARRGEVWQARRGKARHGKVRQARHGEAGRGVVWQGGAGMAWHGEAGHGLAGKARLGAAWRGRHGKARQGWARQARLVIFKQEVLVMEYEMGDVFLAAVIVALASKAALDAWFEGTIFATARAHTEVWKYSDRKGVALIGDLMTCRFCLGYHVCFWLSFLCCFRNYEFVLLVPTALAARAMEYHIELALRRKDDGEA